MSNIGVSDDSSVNVSSQVKDGFMETAILYGKTLVNNITVDTRNDADSFVFQTEKALEEVGDKIDAADKAAVEEDLKALKELVEKTNAEEMTEAQVEEMKAAKEKLMGSAQQLFTKVYEQAQQAAGGAQGANPADDVVDADYKEI